MYMHDIERLPCWRSHLAAFCAAGPLGSGEEAGSQALWSHVSFNSGLDAAVVWMKAVCHETEKGEVTSTEERQHVQCVT